MNKVTQYAPTAARIFLGLVFFVFGLNGFLGFIPQPELSAEAGALMGAFGATGYFFPLLKGTEVLIGIALLSGRFVPLALTVLAPIIVQIFAFHVALQPDGMPMTIIITALTAYLGWAYRGSFTPMLRATAKPAVSTARTGTAVPSAVRA